MSKEVVVVSPENAVPSTYTCHCMEVVSNTAFAPVTVGRLEVHVNSQLEIGSHTASSEVFKKTTIESISPPVF